MTQWRHMATEIYVSTLAQVVACYLTTPSHYINQHWLINSKVQWTSKERNFTRDTPGTNHKKIVKNTYLKFHSHPPGSNGLNWNTAAWGIGNDLKRITRVTHRLCTKFYCAWFRWWCCLISHGALVLYRAVNTRLKCPLQLWHHAFYLRRTWAPSQYKDRLIYVWRFPC